MPCMGLRAPEPVKDCASMISAFLFIPTPEPELDEVFDTADDPVLEFCALLGLGKRNPPIEGAGARWLVGSCFASIGAKLRLDDMLAVEKVV